MKNKEFDELNERLKSLQEKMTQLDKHELKKKRAANRSTFEFIINKSNPITLRMDTNQNHQRPHIHLDYGKERHVASYAIDTGECLAGNASIYNKEVSVWITKNRDLLITVWEITRSAPQPSDIIAELKESEFWL